MERMLRMFDTSCTSSSVLGWRSDWKKCIKLVYKFLGGEKDEEEKLGQYLKDRDGFEI